MRMDVEISCQHFKSRCWYRWDAFSMSMDTSSWSIPWTHRMKLCTVKNSALILNSTASFFKNIFENLTDTGMQVLTGIENSCIAAQPAITFSSAVICWSYPTQNCAMQSKERHLWVMSWPHLLVVVTSIYWPKNYHLNAKLHMDRVCYSVVAGAFSTRKVVACIGFICFPSLADNRERFMKW